MIPLTNFMLLLAVGADDVSRGFGFMADDMANGALVREVAAGSPAAGINLRAGDLIVAVNGTAVNAAARAEALLAQAGNAELAITVRRGSKDFTVPLRSMAAATVRKPLQDGFPFSGIPGPAVPAAAAPQQPLPAKLGIGLQALDPQYRLDLGLPPNEGARVVSMAGEAAAAAGGVKLNDILLSVNGKPVTDNAAVLQALEGAKPNVDIPLDVWRQGRRVPLNVRLKRESFPPDAPPPGAAGAGSEALFARLQSLERRIATLEDEVAELKRQAGGGAPAPVRKEKASFEPLAPPPVAPAAGRKPMPPAAIPGLDFLNPPGAAK